MGSISKVSICVLSVMFSIASGTLVDFSRKTWTVMSLRVAHLEPERSDLRYGDHVIPGSKGMIDLRCIVARESLLPSLGLGHTDVTGLKWILPNPKIIEEGRAYIHARGLLDISLVITEFQKDEDQGEYGCMMTLKDDSVTRYKSTIYIPSLDGAPILSCDLKCQRNTDENCQLMGPYSVACTTFSISETVTHCNHIPCKRNDECHRFRMIIPPPQIPQYYFERSTPIYKQSSKNEGGLAIESTLFMCTAANKHGNSYVEIFIPVSVSEIKDGGIRIEPITLEVGPNGQQRTILPPAPPPPKFIGSRYPEFFQKHQHPIELGCWTSRNVETFEWTFKPVGSHQEHTISKPTEMLSVKQKYTINGLASVLHIKSHTKETGGTYTCRAVAKDGFTMVFKEFGIISTEWGDDTDMNSGKVIARSINGTVTMKCNMVTNAEELGISWDKSLIAEAATVYLQPSPKISFSNDSQTLTIRNLSVDDTGIYSCSTYTGSPGHAPIRGEVTLLVSDSESINPNIVESLKLGAVSVVNAYQNIKNVVDSMNATALRGHGYHD